MPPCKWPEFKDFLCECNTEIQVYAQLEPLQTYTWIITDKFGKQYSGEFTTDANGFWTIQVADLPEGLLTEWSGEFLLQVQDAGCKPVNFKIAQEYDGVRITIRGGTRVKDTLGCDFSCTPAAGAQSTMFEFENAEEVDIVWTSQLRLLFGDTPVIEVWHQTYPGQFVSVAVEIQKTYNDDGELVGIHVANDGAFSGHVIVS